MRRIRQFVRLDASGRVDQDLEVEADDWDRRIIPLTLVEITGHRQWEGLGSLIGWLREPDGRFTAPGPPSPPAPSPLEVRVAKIEDLVKRIATKVGA